MMQPLQDAVQKEAKQRLNDLLNGVERYLSTPYTRTLKEPPAVWKKGSARLLDYGATKKNAPAVLLVPSLINRYYVLDLSKEVSLTRYLKAQGLHPFVMDWGSPAEGEEGFGCADYVTAYLMPALDEALKVSGRKQASVVGYCMGGVLSLALARLAEKKINGIGLLATPWDFHVPGVTRLMMDDGTAASFKRLVDSQTTVPAEIIQTLFYCIDPWVFHRKFSAFGHSAEDEAQRFFDLEYWVNDGVPITRGVAQDCFIEWAHRNALHRGVWKVGGKVINPSLITLPVFAAMPQADKLVPPGCSAPLISQLRDKTIVTPEAGHVGMIVGKAGKSELWQPLCEWLKHVR